MPWGIAAAVVGAAGAVYAADKQSGAAEDAANTQAAAADRSAAMQQRQWEQTQANLRPYLDLGTSQINPLMAALSEPALSQRFSAPTYAEAQATPGYQFTLDQGLKSTQNSMAARGLGTSGAALKGAASFATGLADNTYNDVYNRALSTFNANYSSASNRVNRLQNLVSNGQNAAANQGALGLQSTQGIGNTLASGANAAASGIMGAANATAGGISGATNSIGNALMMYGAQNNASSNNNWAPVSGGGGSGNWSPVSGG